MANTMTAVNNSISRKVGTTALQISRYTLVKKCLGKHIKFDGRSTILTHEEEQLLFKTLEIVPDWDLLLTKHDVKMIVKKYLNWKSVISLY